MTSIEVIAAVSGLISVYFLARQNIWCWPVGLVSVSLAAVVFYDSFLYSDMILHVYYFGMNVYGWIHWSKPKDDFEKLAVTRMTHFQNMGWIFITLIVTLIWGWAMSHRVEAAFPYWDAFTTVASLTAMWFMAQKRLENWVYWFVIDVVAVTIYLLKGLYIFSGQYFIFLILCFVGYRDWKKTMSERVTDTLA